MLFFSIASAAVAPGIALLTYFYLKDKYDAEPLHMVIKVFLLGFLIVLPVMIIQRGLTMWLGDGPLVTAFGISAGVEEVLKWFVLFHMIYNHTEFDEPYDGILYAVAISLGFATVENVLYALASHASIGTMIVRALLPVSGHAMFGVMMGYYLGRAKFSTGWQSRKFLIFSLLFPLFWHGVYDWILNNTTQYWIWFIVPLMAFLWYGGLGKVYRANNRSPFRLTPGAKGQD
ncbi:glutamic-type intramembrane protease PrsW [Paenibacillus timonensis]|uniref:Protease PrsW n=1 Tax=Paenibacillus timonensis TaxID=225915 RepID=A0ABW3S703_9BACL|nr:MULTISPECIES: glutamic-type intramembrane protease PrsW [Paenibacillus]MCH1639530.1 glutamic-type intramembrane protease PrsW [Paenibacillus timonensis]MDU2240594.1 glutamic-type intramembrane protease PrsW [Paenibacillus sp.]GJM80061.1 protease PrsW [Paenibacillus sp. HMSSN-139]